MNLSSRIFTICVLIAVCAVFETPIWSYTAYENVTTTTISLKVTREDGKPIAGAQAFAVAAKQYQSRLLKWHQVSDSGEVAIDLSGKRQNTYIAIARASGYAPELVRIDDPSATVTVVLDRGAEVALQLKTEDDRPLPSDLKPTIFPYSRALIVCFSTSADRTRDTPYGDQAVSDYPVEARGSGVFTTHVDPTSTEPLYALISYTGYLRSYVAGPFDPQTWVTSGTVTVDLPKPAALTVNLDLGEAKPASDVATMRLYGSLQIPGRGPTSVYHIIEERSVTSATIAADDLAPGLAGASAVMASKKDQYDRDAEVVKESVHLDSGDSQTLTLKYIPFKKEWLQGPYTAMLTLQDVHGKPAAGKPYKVTWSESNHPKQTIAQGTVPADGKVRLENLAGVEKESTREDYATLGGVPTFDVEVDGDNVGYIFFGEARQGKLFPPDEGKVKEYTFNIPPKVGDVAPDFAMVDLETSDTIRLSDLKGQVVLLDFWATWCGPCQPVMAENQKILQKNTDAWKGKATILALSIDDDQETVQKHLEKNDWNHTMNAWSPPPADDPDKTGWDSPTAELYGIHSIPTVLLIDQNGVIKERGHITDVEKKIQALIE